MIERVRRHRVVDEAIWPGVLSGLAGGVLLGAAMLQFGGLATAASVVRSESVAVGLTAHLAVAVLVGVGFGLLAWHQRPGTGETVLWEPRVWQLLVVPRTADPAAAPARPAARLASGRCAG